MISIQQLVRPFWYFACLAMMLDAGTTYWVLSQPGISAAELNPVMVWAIGFFGLLGACLAKALVGIMVASVICQRVMWGNPYRWMSWGFSIRRFRFERQPMFKAQRSAAWSLAFGLMATAVVVGNNLYAVRLVT